MLQLVDGTDVLIKSFKSSPSHARQPTRKKIIIGFFYLSVFFFIYSFYITVKKTKLQQMSCFLCHFIYSFFYCIRVCVYLVFERKLNKQKKKTTSDKKKEKFVNYFKYYLNVGG